MNCGLRRHEPRSKSDGFIRLLQGDRMKILSWEQYRMDERANTADRIRLEAFDWVMRLEASPGRSGNPWRVSRLAGPQRPARRAV